MKKWNFLIVMPRIVNKIGDGYSFPLGLPYVSSAIKNAGFQVYTYNLNHHEGKVEELLKEQILRYDIDAVFTGGLSFQYYPLRQLVEAVKTINPDLFVLVGGGGGYWRPRGCNGSFRICRCRGNRRRGSD